MGMRLVSKAFSSFLDCFGHSGPNIRVKIVWTGYLQRKKAGGFERTTRAALTCTDSSVFEMKFEGSHG